MLGSSAFERQWAVHMTVDMRDMAAAFDVTTDEIHLAMHELIDAGFLARWEKVRWGADAQRRGAGRPGHRVDKEARGGKPVMLGLYRDCDS